MKRWPHTCSPVSTRRGVVPGAKYFDIKQQIVRLNLRAGA
jgi:hypothetical protein